MNRIKTLEQIQKETMAEIYNKIINYGPLRYEQHLDDELNDLSNKYEAYKADKISFEEIKPEILKYQAMLPPVIELLKKEDVIKMSRAEQEAYALKCAKYYAAYVTPYDHSTVRVERQSEHEYDWYLYSAVAKTYPGYKNDTYAVWTLNLSLGGLHNGHYDLDALKINEVLNYKRH